MKRGHGNDGVRSIGASSLPDRADVVIVGGGIVGCMTARELAEFGVDAVVIEKGDIGNEQSSRNWGYIRQQAREDPEIPLMLEANGFWKAFESDNDCDIGWRQRGNLRLIQDANDLPWYRAWSVKAKPRGITSELLTSDGVGTVLPGAQGRWAGAAFTPTDGQADPRRATQAVARIASATGATLVVGTTVTAVLTRSGRVVGVATDRGVVAAKTVVVAGGVWTRRLLSPLGINLPLQWVRSTVAETAPVDDFPEIPAVWSPEVSFRNTESGSILFAPSGRADIDIMPSAVNNVRMFLPTLTRNIRTFQVSLGRPAVLDTMSLLLPSRRYAGWEPRPNRSGVQRARRALGRIFPELADVTVARSWAGYIDGTPDNLPVLSGVDGVDGLVVGAGFSGHGFGLSPASGRILADLAMFGECARHDISSFALSRFSQPTYRPTVAVGH